MEVGRINSICRAQLLIVSDMHVVRMSCICPSQLKTILDASQEIGRFRVEVLH